MRPTGSASGVGEVVGVERVVVVDDAAGRADDGVVRAAGVSRVSSRGLVEVVALVGELRQQGPAREHHSDVRAVGLVGAVEVDVAVERRHVDPAVGGVRHAVDHEQSTDRVHPRRDLGHRVHGRGDVRGVGHRHEPACDRSRDRRVVRRRAGPCPDRPSTRAPRCRCRRVDARPPSSPRGPARSRRSRRRPATAVASPARARRCSGWSTARSGSRRGAALNVAAIAVRERSIASVAACDGPKSHDGWTLARVNSDGEQIDDLARGVAPPAFSRWAQRPVSGSANAGNWARTKSRSSVMGRRYRLRAHDAVGHARRARPERLRTEVSRRRIRRTHRGHSAEWRTVRCRGRC